MRLKSTETKFQYIEPRSQRGSTGVLVCSAILVSILGVGAFAADVAHNSTVRSELQSATDAAALAGARALVYEDQNPDAEQYAVDVAAANLADGKPVVTSDDDSVIVEVDRNVQGEHGTCQVTATRVVNNWLAKIFGHDKDTITVVSKAAASEEVTQVEPGMLFPLAVSIDAVPTDAAGKGKSGTTIQRKALKDMKLGDTFSIYINSQQVKNGAFTSFDLNESNANWFDMAADSYLGLRKPDNAHQSPEAIIGEGMNLNNGVSGQKSLAKEPRLSQFKAKEVVFLPVIQGTDFTKAQPLIGWVALKIKQVDINQSGGVVEAISGEIVRAPIRGRKGDLPPFPPYTNVLKELSPSSVRLIPVS